MELPYYPINDFGPLMKGLVIGGLGIFHVFLAQFAIGGGILMCYLEWLAQKGRSQNARKFLEGYFRFLVLISFVVGALTGVGMWFTTIQVSPRTIGLMVDEFHWVWATEWTFFCVEIIAGYLYYRYGSRLSDRSRLVTLATYAMAAWMSLFWINGILSWQLTPGGWPDGGGVWSGFFNPSFWPSLLYRTVASMTIAALIACVVINVGKKFDRPAREELIHKTSHLLSFMLAMPFLGLWYLAVFPEDSRQWTLGGSPTMTLFFNMSIGASFLVGGYALIGMLRQRLYINGATATLLCALAFGATAGGEFVREGVRKPYTVRQGLYSNSITEAEVVRLREVGSVSGDPYPLRDAASLPNDQVRLGMKVFRFQCSICHTVDGVNGLTELTEWWTLEQMRLNIAKLQLTKPFMPPFAGTPEELEALVQFLEWENADGPDQWPEARDDEVLRQIKTWLDEAGTLSTSARLLQRSEEGGSSR